MNKQDILDIPAIQKEVHDKHQKFIRDYGDAIEKVMADHRLFADKILAKLNLLAFVYKEEKVIDEIKIQDGLYRQLNLSKNGNDTYVNIITNGSSIVLAGYTYTDGMDSDLAWPKEKFFKVNEENFDWINFSKKLLDYIHATIYGRKEAMEARLDGLFQPSPFEQIVKTIDEVKKRKSKNGNK